MYICYMSILKVARAAMFADCCDTSSDQCAKNAESVRCGISALTISAIGHFSMLNGSESAVESLGGCFLQIFANGLIL